MTREAHISTLSLAVLGLISQRPCSGYDLRKVFSTTPMGHFSSSPGAIYPALQRLEKAGLVVGTVENKKTLRPRQVYSLTDEGKRELKDRLSRPVTRDDVIWRVDDLLLRFAFMDGVLGRDATVSFLKDFLSNIETYVVSLQEHLNAAREHLPPTGRFAMENGIEQYEMQARWARRVLGEIQGIQGNQRNSKEEES